MFFSSLMAHEVLIHMEAAYFDFMHKTGYCNILNIFINCFRGKRWLRCCWVDIIPKERSITCCLGDEQLDTNFFTDYFSNLTRNTAFDEWFRTYLYFYWHQDEEFKPANLIYDRKDTLNRSVSHAPLMLFLFPAYSLNYYDDHSAQQCLESLQYLDEEGISCMPFWYPGGENEILPAASPLILFLPTWKLFRENWGLGAEPPRENFDIQ